MEKITSLQNKQIKELAALFTKKGRRDSGCFPAEGYRTVTEALNAGAAASRLAVVQGLLEQQQISDLVKKFEAAGASILAVTPKVMKKISGMDSPQGIFAEVRRPPTAQLRDVDFTAGVSVMPCGLSDPRNMGLLVRTLEAAGVRHVILPRGATDPFHPLAVQTSMGAVFHVRFVENESEEAVIESAKESGAPVVATEAWKGRDAARWLAQAPRGFLLMLGNEGAGLSPSVSAAADVSIALPIDGNAESLNVAVTAGVILYLHKALAK